MTADFRAAASLCAPHGPASAISRSCRATASSILSSSCLPRRCLPATCASRRTMQHMSCLRSILHSDDATPVKATSAIPTVVELFPDVHRKLSHLCVMPAHQGAGLSLPPGSGLPACGKCAPACEALAALGAMKAQALGATRRAPMSRHQGASLCGCLSPGLRQG